MTTYMTNEANPVTSERAMETRARILDMALQEFAALGLAGARMERIASAAGVNKALLYYYFKGKDELYLAAVEMAAVQARDFSMAALEHEGSAGERVLRAGLNHFDRVIAQRAFQSLLQQEMGRFREGESAAMNVIMEKVFEPGIRQYCAVLAEGIASGELIEADWMQIQLASMGANVFYFMSAHVWRLTMKEDPLSREALVARRKHLLNFLGQAIFIDREHGMRLAAKIYADTPMPDIGDVDFMFRRKV
jgi:TetR/AcrR family transcriptional regulator